MDFAKLNNWILYLKHYLENIFPAVIKFKWSVYIYIFFSTHFNVYKPNVIFSVQFKFKSKLPCGLQDLK